VQSVVADARNRLWILDTGSVKFAPVVAGGAKLVAVDLATDKVVKSIVFPPDVALPTTYLNDVRFDLRQGTEGVAYITDSSDKGPNAIIVVDLASGKARRRLNDHPSTKAEPKFLPFVEGQPMMQKKPGEPPKNLAMGSDGDRDLGRRVAAVLLPAREPAPLERRDRRAAARRRVGRGGRRGR
jgi:hypothetical protein